MDTVSGLTANRRGPFGLTPSACAGLAVVAIVSVLLASLRTVPWDTALGALAIIWVSALPGLLYLNGMARSPIPIFPAIGLYYIVFFGLPVFATPFGYRVGDRVVLYFRFILDAPSLDVMLAVAGGILCMVAGFYFARGVLFARLPRFRLPNPDPQPQILNVLYWLLLIGSLSYRYVPAIAELPSVGQLLAPASYLALGGFYLQWHAGRLPAWQKWLLLLGCVPLELYARVRIFFITDLLLLAMFFAFVLWRAAQVRLLVGILALGTFLALSYSFVQPFRDGATFADRIASLKTAWMHTPTDGFISQKKAARDFMMTEDRRISPFIHRIGQIWVFQHVYQQTPDPIPYWGGESYRPLFTAFIPRVLYPDKPQEKAGFAFGLRYGFSEGGDDMSSYNMPWIVELFANFGYAGLTLGMCCIGIFLAFIDKVFNADGMSDPEALIGLVLAFRLAYPESNFSVMTGAMPMLFVVLYLYFAIGPRVLSSLVQRLR